MSNEDLAYAAGIIDGEGCITIIKQIKPEVDYGWVYRLLVVVSTTDNVIAPWMKQIFGGSCYYHKSNRINCKGVYSWQVGAKLAKEFLETIYPHLHLKQHQASLAIDFQTLKSSGKYSYQNRKPLEAYEKELKYREQIQALNKYGGSR